MSCRECDFDACAKCSVTPMPTLYEGMRIEAKNSAGSFAKGNLRSKNGDGSWAIDFDDGNKERNIAVSSIRPNDLPEEAQVIIAYISFCFLNLFYQF